MKWIAVLSSLALAGCASGPTVPLPKRPPPPRYDSPFALCQTIDSRSSLSASAEDRRELMKALEVLRSKLPVVFTGRVASIEELNKRAGAPLVQGEIAVIDMSVIVGGSGERDGFSAVPFVVFDGTRFGNAAKDVEDREGANHAADLVRSLFAIGPAPVLGPLEARTTAVHDDSKLGHFDREKALNKLSHEAYCYAQKQGDTCRAMTPFSRKGPSAGPDVFGVTLFVQFVEGDKTCSLLEDRSVPLPKGSTEGRRSRSAFRRLFRGERSSSRRGRQCSSTSSCPMAWKWTMHPSVPMKRCTGVGGGRATFRRTSARRSTCSRRPGLGLARDAW